MKIKPLAQSIGVLALALSISHGVLASSEWQPMPGEKLIKLPALIMARAIEQDFRDSKLAADLRATQDSLGSIQGSLHSLQKAITDAETKDQTIELQHQFLEQKSAYLDGMEQQQALKQQAAQTRIDAYNEVLEELQRDAQRASDPVSRSIREKQLQARSRMEAMTKDVDDFFFPSLGGETSQYNREYAHNIDQIKALQRAISAHDANQSATVDGESVSREEFVRSLLAAEETQLALIDQENEMLGYMARLVALDAQALQMQVAYGPEFEDGAIKDESKPASMVDYFIN